MTQYTASSAAFPQLGAPSASPMVAGLAPSRPAVPAPKRTLWSRDNDLQMDRQVLYQEFTPLVYRLIRQYGGDPELRQDLTGEIYCRFCALLDAYDPNRGVPLRPYLVRQLTAAVYTYARHHWRQQKREILLEEQLTHTDAAPAIDPTPNWLQRLSQQELAAQLPAALAKLPVRQRRVVIWRYYEERSFEEIATILNIQPATARSLLRHGLNHLRKLIGCSCS